MKKHYLEDRQKETQQDIPYSPANLSGYVQILFNTIIGATGVYLLLKFITLINQDVQEQLQLHWRALDNKLRRCQLKFNNNHCFQRDIPPALFNICQDLQDCIIELDNKLIEHKPMAKLWLQTLAQVINAFVDQISFKSFIFLLLTSCSIILVTNIAIGSYKITYYSE